MVIRDESHPAYAVVCPVCQQRMWAPCFDQRYRATKFRKSPHPARMDAAKEASA